MGLKKECRVIVKLCKRLQGFSASMNQHADNNSRSLPNRVLDRGLDIVRTKSPIYDVVTSKVILYALVCDLARKQCRGPSTKL